MHPDNSEPCFLVADLGTSALKAGLFTGNGQQLAGAQVEYSTRYPQPAWAEQQAGSTSSKPMNHALRYTPCTASTTPCFAIPMTSLQSQFGQLAELGQRARHITVDQSAPGEEASS